jgi:hypothetical protein
MAAAALESLADRLEGTSKDSVAIKEEDELPLAGTRARIKDTLDRARNRYDQVTIPTTTRSRGDQTRKRRTKK